jgi:hypothetical protein
MLALASVGRTRRHAVAAAGGNHGGGAVSAASNATATDAGSRRLPGLFLRTPRATGVGFLPVRHRLPT